MAALVETMAYNYENREKPWHGLGKAVNGAMTSQQALIEAGLDWKVLPKPVFLQNGMEIPNYKANVRETDNACLGIVSDRYSIVQNKDAFDFTDSLIDGVDTRYETAGSLIGGRRVWLLAHLPRTRILGDDVDPYICFTNSHDGKGAIQVCMTPVRVVCNNTLNMALKSAKRSWSARHVGKIEEKLREASETLQMANKYMESLSAQAEVWSDVKVDEDALAKLLKNWFPINDDDSDRKKANMKKQQEDFMMCYLAPDIRQYMNTAYGVINAASDFATHVAPMRSSGTYQERNFCKVLDGHPFIDQVVNSVNAMGNI